MATLKLAPELYSKPGLEATPGARCDHREIELTAVDLALTTQIIALGILPAGHKLMAAAMEADDLDSGGPTLTITVGILNMYYSDGSIQASGYTVPAAGNASVYDSNGFTDTSTTPALVSGQNIFTASTVGQAGGRAYPSLAFTDTIGVDYKHDRIIAVQFPAAATTPAAGTLGLILLTDAD